MHDIAHLDGGVFKALNIRKRSKSGRRKYSIELRINHRKGLNSQASVMIEEY